MDADVRGDAMTGVRLPGDEVCKKVERKIKVDDGREKDTVLRS